MKTKTLYFVTLLLASLVWFSLSDAAEKITKSPYPILDSGMWADPIHNPYIFWIDNDRVLFKSVKGNDKALVTKGPFNLSIWEIGKGVKAHTDYFQSVSACISDGTIHRTQKDSQERVQRFYGKFGDERQIEFPKTKGAFFDDVNCRPYDNPEIIIKRKSRAIKLLLDKHGYLDIGASNVPAWRSKEKVKLYRIGDKEGTEIPIHPVHISFPRYYEFKGAYAIYSPHTAKRFWWLYPDGKVEEVTLPTELRPYPTRRGVVAGWGKTKSNRDPGSGGLYLWTERGQPIRLLAGYAREVTISPDGCKIAFVHYPYVDATKIDDPAPITLKAINLCMEEQARCVQEKNLCTDDGQRTESV